MDDKPGVLPSEVDKVTSNAFNNYMGTLKSMPEDNAWAYRASPKTASLIGATLRNPADRMAFFEKHLSGTITPELILKYAKETRALLSSGQKLPEGSSKADMEYAANYLTFIANKIGFNGTQRVMEEHKMDPTVINKQWDIFTMRRDTALRTISTFKQNTNLTQAQQDAGGTMLELLMGNYNSINQGKDLLNIVTHVPIGADVANTVLRAKIKSLGLDSWNSTEDLLTTLVNFTKQDPTKDYLSPTIIGLLSAQPGDTIDQIQSRIQEYESFNGLDIKKRWVEDKDAWFSNGKMYPVLSTDTMGRATMGESAPRMDTGSMTPDSWANPMNQVKMNYDNYVYGKRIPGRKTSDGKDIMDTDNNFTVTNDNMIDAYRSALPMSTNKELLKRDGSKGVVVLNALMKVYDAHESREERVAHISDPNHPFYKWAMQFPVGPDGKPSPIDQSRINWLAQTLSKDELSYTTAIELGLNDPSHIGVNTSLSRPQLESQARFKSLPMYDAEYTRNTNMQDDAGIQQSSNYTRLPDGSYYYDPTSNEPVLVKNEQGNYMDQAGNAAFKLGTNPDLNTRLSDRWLESNAGSTWELVNPLTGVSEKRQIVFGKQNEGTLGNYTEMIINQETNTIEMHEYRALPPKRFALSKDKNFQHIVKQLYPKKLLEHKNYDLPKLPITIDPNKPNQPIINTPAPVVSTPVETQDQKKERFKKEGMTDADIERMLKFKSVNPDAVSPGSVSGNAEDRMAKIMTEDTIPEFVQNKPTDYEHEQTYWKNIDDKTKEAKQELLTMFDDNSKFQKWLNNYMKPTMEDVNNATTNSKFAESISRKELRDPSRDTEKKIAQIYSFRNKMIDFFHLDKEREYTNSSAGHDLGKGKKGNILSLTNQERIDIAKIMYNKGIFSEQEFTNIKKHYDERTFYETKNAQDRIDEAAKQEKSDWEQAIANQKFWQEKVKNKPQQDKIDEAAKQELLTMFDNDSSKKSKVNAFYNKAKMLGMAYDQDHPDTWLNESDSLNIAESLYKNNTLTKEEYTTIKEQLLEAQKRRGETQEAWDAKHDIKKLKKG